MKSPRELTWAHMGSRGTCNSAPAAGAEFVVVVFPSATLFRRTRPASNQQVPPHHLSRCLGYYCGLLALLLLIVQAPQLSLGARKLTSGDDAPALSYRHYQETSGDTTDNSGGVGGAGGSQDADQSPYDPATGVSELADDRPPPPNELSFIRLNDTSVVVRWEFPDGSLDQLQFFKVQYKSTNRKTGSDAWKTDPQEIPTTTRALQINGLRPGNFLFSVIAVYDNDDNVPSEPLKFRIKARSKIKPYEMPNMEAPRIFWSEAEHDYFRFKWKYEPKDNDTEYFGFLVYYRSAHSVADFTIYNTLDNSVEIAEVEADTPYETKVVAYNTVGVSEFSETITIRTKSKPNVSTTAITTTQAPPEQSITTAAATTMPPLAAITTTTTAAPAARDEATSFGVMRPLNPYMLAGAKNHSSPPPVNLTHNTVWQTGRVEQPSTSHPSNSTSANTIYQSIGALFEPLFTDQSDAMLIVKCLLMVLLPLLLIVTVLIIVIRRQPHNKPKKSPSESSSSSSNASMQFDLEINGYFKNSFPGVEKEYPTDCLNVQNGFVNNHPHIDDST